METTEQKARLSFSRGEIVYWFSAEWCGPCKAMQPVVESAGFEYRKIDLDEEPELAQEYRVQSVPTFLRINHELEEVARSVGAKPKKKLLAELFD